ncbi:phosphatidylethanolamine-binding protein [Lactifluus subvellereus]|nr:phosphatidylethanolamine-binding protein [Lactifluus subvellereus]
MLFLSAVVLSFLGSLVNAQANDNAIGIAAIEAHFKQSGLVPDLLAMFNPSSIMTVNFPGLGAITPGQLLTQDQSAQTPQISIVPANNTVAPQGDFTIVMADADIVGTDETAGQTRHWLVNGVTLTGTAPLVVSLDKGVAITQYAGPGPKAGSGAHRYVILLLPQPATFVPPANLNQPNAGVAVFKLTDYIKNTNLGQPIAGMYFDVQNGDPAVNVVPTSPVVSSTLKPVTPATSAASKAAPSASGSAGSQPTKSPNAATRFVGNSVVALTVTVSVLLGSYMCL